MSGTKAGSALADLIESETNAAIAHNTPEPAGPVEYPTIEYPMTTAREAVAYTKFRAAAQALKACNAASIAASEQYRAALQELSEAAAP